MVNIKRATATATTFKKFCQRETKFMHSNYETCQNKRKIKWRTEPSGAEWSGTAGSLGRRFGVHGNALEKVLYTFYVYNEN